MFINPTKHIGQLQNTFSRKGIFSENLRYSYDIIFLHVVNVSESSNPRSLHFLKGKLLRVCTYMHNTQKIHVIEN